MSQDDVKMLHDRDVEKRKAAIKRVAKAKNKKALKQLARMVADDPDPEVRSLARKAGVYIRQQLGELPQQHQIKEGVVYVSDRNKASAQKELNEAVTHQINDDYSRMMKSMRKALKLNPNLRRDSYFLNLAESATGESGTVGVAMLDDVERQERVEREQARLKRDQNSSEHWGEVNATSWQDVMFDLTLYFVIVAVGTMLALFIMIQSATAFINRLDENSELWRTNAVDEEGNPINLIEVEQSFRELGETLEAIPFAFVFGYGLGYGFSSVVTLLIMAALTHFTAQIILSGTGSIRYLLHRWTTLYSSRTIIVYFLAYIAIALVFNEGGLGIVVVLPSLVIFIITLATIFQSITLVGNSYNFGFVKSLVAFAVGGIAVIILSSLITAATGFGSLPS